ncbi:hypothetical protein [Pseudoalteromonas luteoviolacea]|uniref:Lipoprotein n=1 Tax=Pseudoalteromonas luteoviolacea S4060-1 TaxID=1365257 RepID=A0A167JJU5_9GAMM|nr:hypothetical protein [Pseudoalteromonas luteoviolacea]KZN61219.1 hypothetical protein N478_03940 [Pseudoalteromonas luteoviolacea S4060-1]
MRLIAICIVACVLGGCTSSVDYTGSKVAAHLTNQCFYMTKPTFVFEGRCADLTGINNNSEFCNGIQVVGEGGFPESWDAYVQIRSSFDKNMFDRLAFEKQRSMLGYLDSGEKIIITRVVHHGWGTVGRFWAVRGEVVLSGRPIEVELPSSYLVHHVPFWLDGREKSVPFIDSSFVERCDKSK